MRHIPQLSDPQTTSKGYLENFVIQSTNLSFDPSVIKSIEVTIPELTIHPCQRDTDIWALLAWGTTPKDTPNINIDPFAPTSGTTSLRFEGNAEYTFSEGDSMRRSSIKLFDDSKLTSLVAPLSYIDGDGAETTEGSDTSYISRPILRTILEGSPINESRIPRPINKTVTVIKEDTESISKISSEKVKSTKEDNNSAKSNIQQRIIVIKENNNDLNSIPLNNKLSVLTESTSVVSSINTRLISTIEDTLDSSRISRPLITSVIEESLNSSKITSRITMTNEDNQVSSISFGATTGKITIVNED